MKIPEFSDLSDPAKRELLQTLIAEQHRRDPVAWARDRIGIHLWSKQQEIARAVAKYRRVVSPSAHQCGKTLTAAIMAAHWIDTHPPAETMVVTTAPTYAQVRTVLWPEINKIHRAGNLAGYTNQTEWHIDSRLVGFGRKPADTDPAAFQGLHARYLLVIIDEGCGVAPAMYDAAESLATNPDAHIFVIGNPDDSTSRFAEICNSPLWHVIQMSAFDSPNFTGEDVPPDVAKVLISQQWVEERKLEWGEDSAIYKSKVLGQFANDAENSCVPFSWAEMCRYVNLPAEGERVLGVDVGAGGDRTAITARIGHKLLWQRTSTHDDAMACVGEIVQAASDIDAEWICIDVIGVGFGVAGRLQELHNEGILKARVVKVNVGLPAPDKTRFANLKAAMWWEIGRELSREKAWDLEAASQELIGELTTTRWHLNSAGRIKIESKDDIRKRSQKSPDLADSLLLAFYSPYSEARTSVDAMIETSLPGVRRR